MCNHYKTITPSRHRILSIFCLCWTVVLLLSLQVVQAMPKKATMMAVSFGDGRVALFWPPNALFYNGGGWQLQDKKNGRIVARYNATSLEQGLAALGQEQQQKMRAYFAKMRTTKDPKLRKSQRSFLLMGAMADFSAARKLGMAALLDNVPPGRRAYRLFIVAKNGKRTGRQISSRPIDSRAATPQPASILGLRGVSENSTTQLFWLPAGNNHQTIPAPLCTISRLIKGGQPVNLTPDPVWISADRDPAQPAYVDGMAPIEARLTYTVQRMDIFGRLSAPATVTVLNEDAAALAPPKKITATAGKEEVELSWQPKDNPFTSGYVIERSRREHGLYEVLTAEGLSRGSDSFTDTKVQAGFTYYYRVRSVGPRGDVGPAPDGVAVMVQNDGEPDSPENLKAEVQPTRVILRWQAMPLPVAGYIVEKKKMGDDTWVRINSRLATRPELEDPINLGDYGTRSYRVTAVAFGNVKSDPAEPVTLQLPGHAPVPAPTLLDITSEQGRVSLRFTAGKPKKRTDIMLLVRGNDSRDLGLVIARDIDVDVTRYTDTLVKPGQDYWYALIALDEEGHCSKMGNKLFVIVASPEIPRPDRPEVELEEKPFRRVVISFDAPKEFLRAAVTRKIDDGPWITIAADIAGVDHIVDADPPRTGMVGYRICYLDESHHWGEPSKTVSLTMDD